MGSGISVSKEITSQRGAQLNVPLLEWLNQKEENMSIMILKDDECNWKKNLYIGKIGPIEINYLKMAFAIPSLTYFFCYIYLAIHINNGPEILGLDRLTSYWIFIISLIVGCITCKIFRWCIMFFVMIGAVGSMFKGKKS